MDMLSVFDLIRSIDQRKIDSDVYKCCVEVDELIQQGNIQQAIRTAKGAVDRANKRRRNVTTVGIAHLYVAVALHLSNDETDRDRALAECSTAIMRLRGVDDYCHAVAEITQVLYGDGA